MNRLWWFVQTLDHLMRNFPSLAQVWLVEFFIVLPLALAFGKAIDIRGAWGYPGSGESLDGGFWVMLGIAGVGLFFFFRHLVSPRFRNDTHTPVFTAGDITDIAVIAVNRQAAISYPFFTSHPAYGLLLLTTVWIPIVMVWMTVDHGGNSVYYRAAGWVGIAVVAAMILLRLVFFYGLRRGVSTIRNWASHRRISPRRVGWEMAWRPTLLLVGMMYAIVFIPVTLFWRNEFRTIAALPIANADMAEDAPDPYVFQSGTPRVWVRVEGAIIGEPFYWPAAENRGGDNYRGMGVRVALDTGGEAWLFAESLSVPDLIGHLRASRADGRLRSHGYLANAISENQTRYYGIDESVFHASDGVERVIVIHGYP